MVARDVLAAVLILVGTASVTAGGFLIATPAGYITLGLLLLGLGVAIGIGEREPTAPALDEVPGPPTAASAAPAAPPASASAGGAPAETAAPAPPADLVAASIPLANYLGRTGSHPPVEVPAP